MAFFFLCLFHNFWELKMKLSKEKNSLTLTAKKLGRDLEKVLVYYWIMQLEMFNAFLVFTIIF